LPSRTSQRYNPSLAKSVSVPPHQKPTDKQADEKEHRSDNRRLAKKRVQWLIEHSTSYQLLCWVDSLVLRNPLLRQAPNRQATKKLFFLLKMSFLMPLSHSLKLIEPS